MPDTRQMEPPSGKDMQTADLHEQVSGALTPCSWRGWGSLSCGGPRYPRRSPPPTLTGRTEARSPTPEAEAPGRLPRGRWPPLVRGHQEDGPSVGRAGQAGPGGPSPVPLGLCHPDKALSLLGPPRPPKMQRMRPGEGCSRGPQASRPAVSAAALCPQWGHASPWAEGGGHGLGGGTDAHACKPCTCAPGPWVWPPGPRGLPSCPEPSPQARNLRNRGGGVGSRTWPWKRGPPALAPPGGRHLGAPTCPLSPWGPDMRLLAKEQDGGAQSTVPASQLARPSPPHPPRPVPGRPMPRPGLGTIRSRFTGAHRPAGQSQPY